MKKRKICVHLLSAISAVLLISCFSFTLKVSAAEDIEYKGRVIATKEDDVMTYVPKSGDNIDDLEYLLNNDKEKHLIIPKDSKVRVSQAIYIGDNTTIDATGATIIQTNPDKSVLKHKVDGYCYNAIRNVRIVGGTWKSQSNITAHTFVRFAHGRNLKFRDMTIISNYQSHALELIACKDVTVTNCTLKAENHGTCSASSVEDALQIDVATPKTAPGVLYETGSRKYVNGQVSKNVLIDRCTIYGARGICANYAASEPEFHNKYHRNITITNCDITGTASQGIAMYNTIHCLIQGNTVRTTSLRENLAYPSGINLYLFGKSSGGTNQIINNTVYGMRRGIYINSRNVNAFYGKTIVTDNKVYVRKNIKDAQCLDLRQCRFITREKNKLGHW